MSERQTTIPRLTLTALAFMALLGAAPTPLVSIVAGQALTAITVTPTNPAIAVGQIQPLTVTKTFDDGSTQVFGWTAKASMPAARHSPAAEVINGILYVAGGNNGGPTSTLQAYNPATNTWSTLAPMPGGRYSGDGAGVINGKLYVAGGWTYSPSLPNNNLWVYDPPSNTWSSKANMPILSGCGATGVMNGLLYVYTPCDGSGVFANYLHAYDPATNTWTIKTAPPHAHQGGAGAVIGGKFYLVGGWDELGSGSSSVTGILDVYDPVMDTWATKVPMPTARKFLAGGVIGGKLYAVGGIDNGSLFFNTVEVYDPVTDTWTSRAPMPTARAWLAAGAVNGVLYAVGGVNGSYLGTNEAFTPSELTWSSGNTAVATVDANGLATGLGLGTTTITATSGSISGSATLTVASSVFTLSVSKAGTGSGTVTSSPAGIDCGAACANSYAGGTVVTLTATPASGSVFAGWSGDADCSDGMVALNVNTTCTATFNQTYTLTVTKTGTGSGTVFGSPGLLTVVIIDCGVVCQTTQVSGTVVTLTTTADSDSYFAGWGGDPDCLDGVVTLNANKTCTATFNIPTPPLTNISTRARVETLDNREIAGFIIGGSGSKQVLIRGRGPSLSGAPFNLGGTLANPYVRLYSFSAGADIAQNDDWGNQSDPLCAGSGHVCGSSTQITATGMDPCVPNPSQTVAPPNCAQEAALLITLPPGSYSAIMSGVNNGVGVGLVEVFDVDGSPLPKLVNISTRARVLTGDDRMIGGFILGAGTGNKQVLIRARGPSMSGAPFNLGGTLANPYVQLYSFSAGAFIAQNDNWGDQSDPLCAGSGYVCGMPTEITATGMDPCVPNPTQTVAPPGCAQESAILITLPPGSYSAVVSGVNNGTGIGLVEIFDVSP